MDIFKRPVFLVIFLAALVVALIWSYIDKRRQDSANQKAATEQSTATPEKITNLTNVDPGDFDSVVKNDLALANSKAVTANSNNKLAAVVVDLPADMLPNSGTSRYVFVSDKDNSNNWVITISQASNNYIRASIPKEDYLGDPQPINTTLWKFNYVTALQIAEKNGGLEWREKNQLAALTLTLKHLPPKNWLTWTVKYQGKDTELTKEIDANSGQILEADTTASQ